MIYSWRARSTSRNFSLGQDAGVIDQDADRVARSGRRLVQCGGPIRRGEIFLYQRHVLVQQ
jgi:hypothetical protein